MISIHKEQKVLNVLQMPSCVLHVPCRRKYLDIDIFMVAQYCAHDLRCCLAREVT